MMKRLNTKGMTGLRAVAVGLMLGVCMSGPVVAQEVGPVLRAQEAAQPADDDGFDDWGLLGLLGLAGLAGLKKREPEVHTTDRSGTTGR